jgi:hypothetical protein
MSVISRPFVAAIPEGQFIFDDISGHPLTEFALGKLASHNAVRLSAANDRRLGTQRVDSGLSPGLRPTPFASNYDKKSHQSVAWSLSYFDLENLRNEAPST